MKNTGKRIFGGALTGIAGMAPYRLVRTVVLGVVLGLGLSLAVFWARAQLSGEPVPLITALQVVSVMGDVDLMLLDVPQHEVVLPGELHEWEATLDELAHAFDLAVCWTSETSAVVVPIRQADRIACAGDLNTADVVGEAPGDGRNDGNGGVESAPVEDRPDEAYRFRVRLVQIDETKAAELGVDWSGGMFETAAGIVAGAGLAVGGYFPSPELDDTIRMLEQEGVATRLEDLTLMAREGRSVSFNRGGSINVALVGGGSENISRSYQYGLGVDLQAQREADGVALEYVFNDSNPSNTSDPRNVQLAATSSGGQVVMQCGESAVLSSIYTSREEGSGEGLPSISHADGVGYLVGVGSDRIAQSALVLTVDLGCVEVLTDAGR